MPMLDISDADGYFESMSYPDLLVPRNQIKRVDVFQHFLTSLVAKIISTSFAS